jgi:hypothetical protein
VLQLTLDERKNFVAKLVQKNTGDSIFECYSERGLLSYFFFRYLAKKENFSAFLNKLFIGREQFTNLSNVTLFSELDLGNKGFGKPDGAFYFESNKNPYFVFVEGKFNETYLQACNKSVKYYNSTIKGQLELKLRLISCIREDSLEQGIIQENEEIKDFFKGRDVFYRNNPTSFRKVKLMSGVKRFFSDYLRRCNRESIFFLVISKDKLSPFVKLKEDLQPNSHNLTWKEVQKQLLWENANFIESLSE